MPKLIKVTPIDRATGQAQPPIAFLPDRLAGPITLDSFTINGGKGQIQVTCSVVPYLDPISNLVTNISVQGDIRSDAPVQQVSPLDVHGNALSPVGIVATQIKGQVTESAVSGVVQCRNFAYGPDALVLNVTEPMATIVAYSGN